MNKFYKIFITLISAFTLILSSISSSFAKVEGDYIVYLAYDTFNSKIISFNSKDQNLKSPL